jgi:hypothetical protein
VRVGAGAGISAAGIAAGTIAGAPDVVGCGAAGVAVATFGCVVEPHPALTPHKVLHTLSETNKRVTAGICPPETWRTWVPA